MDYLSIFEISGSGMSYEKLRLEVAANNIANANVPLSVDGQGFVPQRVVGKANSIAFSQLLRQMDGGVADMKVTFKDGQPRVVLEPGHPLANEAGEVRYPAVNSVDEVVTMLSATRAFEANVKAVAAARAMAVKALEIGS